MQFKIEKAITERKGFLKETWEAGHCALAVLADAEGPYAYVFRHSDVAFSPWVTIYRVSTDKAAVKVNLNFTHISVELRESERVLQNVREIEEFCTACAEEGLFKIEQ